METYDKVSIMKKEDAYKRIAQELIMSTGAFECARLSEELDERMDRLRREAGV